MPACGPGTTSWAAATRPFRSSSRGRSSRRPPAPTSRITVAPFVINVMNRHPAVLARMASTLQIVSGGRLILGIGIGGHPDEHAALGIPFPAAPERVARLEEAVAVIRAMWTGGPVTRPSPFYPLDEAYSRPDPRSVPRILIGGETAPGARLAGRIGDGWSTFDNNFEKNLPPTSRRSRRPAGGGPTSSYRRLPGRRLARPWAARRDRLGPRSARDMGALEGSRGRRRDRHRQGARGHRRAGRRRRALVSGGRPTRRPGCRAIPWHHRPDR